MPSVFIKTYGCQMNERDSEAVASQLVAKGYALARDEASADVILLNTCSVRDAAEQKALGKMRNLAVTARRRRPKVVLGILGCMAQARGRDLLDQLPDLDLVLGTQKVHHTAEHLAALLNDRHQPICDTGDEAGSESAIRSHLVSADNRSLAVTAYVSIMQGCNQRCTFCIVPVTRGPERSRSIPDIVAECRELADRGVKEIVLLGQIVTSYGRRDIGPLNGLSAFVQLLEAVHAIDGLERLRFTAPHPKGYGDDLIAAYGRLPKLCESAHLPAQSGSNRILKLMHRGYTVEGFQALVANLRRVQPGLGVTTDLIVGFPGETDGDFAQTLELVRAVEFDNAYLFKYSPRQNTPASSLPDPVPLSVIETRHGELLRQVNEIGARKYARFVGRSIPVLVEGPSRKNPARLAGRTRCNKIVVFDGPPSSRGRVIDVRIERVGCFTLYGSLPASPNPGEPAVASVAIPVPPPAPSARWPDTRLNKTSLA